MDPLTCSRCGAAREASDNFCRRCGHQLTVTLPALSRVEGPALRAPGLPVPSRAIPASLIGSVAVLAIGTGVEWLARRAAGGAVRAAGRALVPALGRRPARQKQQGDVSVDELLYVRKVQLRR